MSGADARCLIVCGSPGLPLSYLGGVDARRATFRQFHTSKDRLYVLRSSVERIVVTNKVLEEFSSESCIFRRAEFKRTAFHAQMFLLKFVADFQLEFLNLRIYMKL